MRTLGVAVAAALVAACSKGTETPAPAASAAAAVAPATSAGAAPSAAAAASTVSGPSAWSGTYTATVGSLTVPEWTGVKFRGEDASVGLGGGAMNVALDATGRATGKLDGALGPASVDGAMRDSTFSATLVPADLATGFTGTAIGTREGETIKGTMRLSLPTGNVIREASFTLAPTHSK